MKIPAIWQQGGRAVFTILFLTLLLDGCGRPTGSDRLKREYRMQVTVGPTTSWGLGAQRFAQLARERTGGRIVVKPYFRSQLLKGAQLKSAQMVSAGAIDLALESTINISPVVPQMNLFVLPFFVSNYGNLDRLEEGEAGRMLFAALRQKGLEPLAWGENGFRQLTNNRRPVRNPEDLRGLRIRVVGSPIFIDIFHALGADPVNMNWGDAVTAFQQGTVDGQENPVGILVPVQIYQYHRFATFWNYACDPLVLYWCKKEWDAFPQDIRTALRLAALDAAAFEKALVRVGLDDGEALKVLTKTFRYHPLIPDPRNFLAQHGMEIIIPAPADAERFRAATRPVMHKWIRVTGEDVYAAALRDLAAQ